MSGGEAEQYSDALRSVEALSPDGTNLCSMPDLPDGRKVHSQDGLTVCGDGFDVFSVDSDNGNNCVNLTDGQWTQSHTLLHGRRSHSSWALGDGRVVLMGGWYSRNTTEIISPGSSTTTEGFTLKYDTWYNCQTPHPY